MCVTITLFDGTRTTEDDRIPQYFSTSARVTIKGNTAFVRGTYAMKHTASVYKNIGNLNLGFSAVNLELNRNSNWTDHLRSCSLTPSNSL
jgi:hypothetical protein